MDESFVVRFVCFNVFLQPWNGHVDVAFEVFGLHGNIQLVK